MTECGAKTRGGGRCKQPGGANGRCHFHGKRAGRPPATGRDAAYTAIFGKRFAELATHPDLLKANSEIALFDMFLIERAEVFREGFSAAWIEDLRAVAETIEQSVKQADTNKMRESLTRLKALTKEGGDRQASWSEALAAAKTRADMAVKADANVAKREQTVVDRDIAAMMCLWLDLTTRVIAGCMEGLRAGQLTDADVTRRVYSEFKREVVGAPASLRAGGGERALA